MHSIVLPDQVGGCRAARWATSRFASRCRRQSTTAAGTSTPTPLWPDGSWGVSGRPQTLLLLTLLSDVGPDDAPTRIRIGSHRDVAAVLSAEPVTFEQAGRLVDEATSGREVAHATGEPGDMYLVHPFTAHAADVHRGVTPRFMAQAPVVLTGAVTPGSESPLARVWD